MAAVIGLVIYFSMWIATGIVWILYYICVGLFYIFAFIFYLVVEAVDQHRSKPKTTTKKQLARQTSQTINDMHSAADAAVERVRRYASR